MQTLLWKNCVLATLILAGCGRQSAPPSEEKPAQTHEQVRKLNVPVYTEQGEMISLTALKGEYTILVLGCLT